MRDIAMGAALVAALLVIDLALWISAPGRQRARSAVLAGLVVGRCAAGVAW